MFGLFGRFLARSGVKPTLDSIRFDSAGYEFGGEPEPGQLRLWCTEAGDGLGLFLFMKPPDLPSARTLDALRGFYAQGVEASGGHLIEASLLRVAGCPAVKVVIKVPQQPTGMTYVGSITIPFRDFSFVAKVQCKEHGATGFREAVLLDRRMADGEIPAVHRGKMHLPDSELDREEYDAEFPLRPVSRVRQVLRRVCDSLAIDAEVASATGFPLPRE